MKKECERIIKEMELQIGDELEIIKMSGEKQYTGRTGVITHFDDAGQIHGTWGGCAIIPVLDQFKIINRR